MDTDESGKPETFLNMKTRTELESDLERCQERKQNLEEEKNALYNMRIDLEAMLKQREEELSSSKAQLESAQLAREEVVGELENLKNQRPDDLEKIEALNQKILQIEQEKENLQEENRRLNEYVEQCERDKETYKAYSNEAERLIEVKTGKLMADLREAQQLSEQYKAEISERDEKIRVYEEEVERVREEREALFPVLSRNLQ